MTTQIIDPRQYGGHSLLRIANENSSLSEEIHTIGSKPRSFLTNT